MAPINYAACIGSGTNGGTGSLGSPWNADGAFQAKVPVALSRIRDGLSKTAAMSESILGAGTENANGSAPGGSDTAYAYLTVGTPLSDANRAAATSWNVSNRRGFMWASGEIGGERDTRPWFGGLALRLGLALLLAVLVFVAALVVVFATPFAQWLGELLGIGEAALGFWTTVDWPFFFALAVAVFLLLYRAAPHARMRRVRDDLVGAFCGVAVWLLASALFSLYLAHFGSYERVYGVLGTAIAFLVWAWILDLTLLGGLEVSLALGRRRASAPKADGHDA